MKLSEFIKVLQEDLDIYGDTEVLFSLYEGIPEDGNKDIYFDSINTEYVGEKNGEDKYISFIDFDTRK